MYLLIFDKTYLHIYKIRMTLSKLFNERTFFASTGLLLTATAATFGFATDYFLQENNLNGALSAALLASSSAFLAALAFSAYRTAKIYQRFENWKPREEMTPDNYRARSAVSPLRRKLYHDAIRFSGPALDLTKLASMSLSLVLAGANTYALQFPIDRCFGDEGRRNALVATLPNGTAYLSTSQTAAVTYDLRSPLFQTADYILPSFEQASEAGKSFCESASAPNTEPRHQSSITLEVAP
jgi:hypothetical protein